jgi:Fur family transcriptional regulator, peroxide stress response regulator
MMSNHAQLLKAHGLKATFQRIGLLNIIQDKGHASVDEIYQTIRTSQPTLSLATIYKNILTMLEKGLLSEVLLEGHKPKYEIQKHEHIHLICEACGSVEDSHITSTAHDEIHACMHEDHFTMSRAQINFYGLCKQCRAKQLALAPAQTTQIAQSQPAPYLNHNE